MEGREERRDSSLGTDCGSSSSSLSFLWTASPKGGSGQATSEIGPRKKGGRKGGGEGGRSSEWVLRSTSSKKRGDDQNKKISRRPLSKGTQKRKERPYTTLLPQSTVLETSTRKENEEGGIGRPLKVGRSSTCVGGIGLPFPPPFAWVVLRSICGNRSLDFSLIPSSFLRLLL